MIVDFASIKKRLDQISGIILRNEIKKRMPFLGSVGKHCLHEGSRHSYETVDHEKQKLDLQEAGSSFTISKEEMGKITFGEIIEKLQGIAKDVAGQMERTTFQKLLEELDQHGRTTRGNSSPFSETMFKALEMIEIDFNDDARNQPNLPVIVMHPTLMAKVKEQEEKMTEEERQAFTEKEKEILDKKYQDFIAREAKRRIVD